MSDEEGGSMEIDSGEEWAEGSEEVVSDEDWKEEAPQLVEQRSYQVMAKKDVIQQAKELIDGVRELLGLSSSAAAAALLRHFKWNRERLLECYMSNPEKTLKDVGMGSLALEVPPPADAESYVCKICLEEVAMSSTFALGCGHRYCKACWADFLEVQISVGPNCVFAQCMSPGCTELCHEECYQKVVSPQAYERYKEFLHRSFIDQNPNVKWCPAAGCENSVRCDRRGRRQPVTCACGFCFCFQCADADIGNHLPASCNSVKLWSEKNKDESENVKWMMANCKRCPKCQKHIEKNGGCMHMTCRKEVGGCGFEFCWLCRGSWSEHGSATGGYYACLSEDMQILTSEGFMFLDQLASRYHNVSVASYDSHTGHLLYENPLELIVNEKCVQGQMVAFHNPEDDMQLVVTLDHEMLVSEMNDEWKKVPAGVLAHFAQQHGTQFQFRSAAPCGLSATAAPKVLDSVMTTSSVSERDGWVKLALESGASATCDQVSSEWQVRVSTKEVSSALNGSHVFFVPYEGRTWCVTMPHGLIVTRHAVKNAEGVVVQASRPFVVGNCNKYDASSAKSEDLKADQVKTELDEYMFYYHRYTAHRSAYSVATKQMKEAEEKGQRLQKKLDVQSHDIKFLLSACAALKEERRVLMWSYCQGYFLKREGEKSQKEYSLFEHLQENVEKFCDALSGLYERNEDTITDYQAFMQWKESLINMTSVCEKQLANFIAGVGDGLTEDRF